MTATAASHLFARDFIFEFERSLTLGTLNRDRHGMTSPGSTITGRCYPL
jgi:hypothetical protein